MSDTMLDRLIEAIHIIQRSAPKVSLGAIDIDDKSRERLVFEMMKMDRQVSAPNPKDGARFSGVVKVHGVEITSPSFPRQNNIS